MRPKSCCLWPVFAAMVLGGCGAHVSQPADDPSGPVREHWQLSHRVPESSTVRVVGHRLDDYSESSRVSFSTSRNGAEAVCSVSFYVAGWGGPENKVGEQVPATVRGRPAVRNGAGAEGDYLIWQRSDGTWAESICDDEGLRVFQDRLADIVTNKPSDLVLPFDVMALPPGLRATSIEQDLRSGETTVYVSGRATKFGHTQTSLVLTFDGAFDEPGRATVIGGYPATVDETPKFPGLCLKVQGHDVCVGAESDDTGPYPDRSAELPVMTAVAETLRFPVDVDDRSSWFPAQDVFG
jgi:hypothetical protein